MDMPTKDGRGTRLPHTEADQRNYQADIDWTGTIQNGPLAVGFDHFYGISASLDMHPYIYIDGDQFVGECIIISEEFCIKIILVTLHSGIRVLSSAGEFFVGFSMVFYWF